MFKPELLTLVVNEEMDFLGNVRKISVPELSEFLRVLSVAYSIATNMDNGNLGVAPNIDTCLREILLLENAAISQDKSSTFTQNIDVFYQKYYSQSSYIFGQLEISSINYNSPLKLTINGRSIGTLLLAVTMLGGEVNLGDYSVKMPGIAETISSLSTTYLEIQKYEDNKESVDLLINQHLLSLPHQDINQLNALNNKT